MAVLSIIGNTIDWLSCFLLVIVIAFSCSTTVRGGLHQKARLRLQQQRVAARQERERSKRSLNLVIQQMKTEELLVLSQAFSMELKTRGLDDPCRDLNPQEKEPIELAALNGAAAAEQSDSATVWVYLDRMPRGLNFDPRDGSPLDDEGRERLRREFAHRRLMLRAIWAEKEFDNRRCGTRAVQVRSE